MSARIRNRDERSAHEVWERNAERWATLGPPWRPSAEDLVNYRTLCQEGLTGNVLILGATPELRDLVARERPHGASPPVVVADVSSAMLERMSALLQVAKPKDERWVVSDWCDLSFPMDSFDLILGDVIWQLMSVPKQMRLREVLAGMLKPKGRLVIRFRFRAPHRLVENPIAVVRHYLSELDRSPQHSALLRDSMVVHLGDIFVDPETKCIDYRRVARALHRAARVSHSAAYRKFLREATEVTANGVANLTSQTKAEILSIFGKRFMQLGEATATDYVAAADAILAFRKLNHED